MCYAAKSVAPDATSLPQRQRPGLVTTFFLVFTADFLFSADSSTVLFGGCGEAPRREKCAALFVVALSVVALLVTFTLVLDTKVLS